MGTGQVITFGLKQHLKIWDLKYYLIIFAFKPNDSEWYYKVKKMTLDDISKWELLDNRTEISLVSITYRIR